MFRICLIGCGNMAKSGHAPSLRLYASRHPDVELSACCDPVSEKTAFFCREFGFLREYADYMEMLRTERPDAVLVLTPVALTARVSMDVIRTGTNVMLEKPPGIHAEETRAIHECALKHGVHARTAFNRRYMPLLRALCAELAACGEMPLFADCQFVRIRRTDADFCTTAIHAIDCIRYILQSDYREASFDYVDFDYKNGRRGTNYRINARFDSGAAANISFLPCGGCVTERITLSCTDYTFFLELPVWSGLDMPGRLVCTSAGEVYKTVVGEYETMFESSGFYDESAGFLDAIRRGDAPVSDVITGVQAVEIADCMRRRAPVYRR